MVKLKGLFNDVIPAAIVRMIMKLTDGHKFVNVACAVVENLNYSLILGADVVQKLSFKTVEEQFDISNVINVDEPDDCSNDDVTDMRDKCKKTVVYLQLITAK